jgi:hypothetical protein
MDGLIYILGWVTFIAIQVFIVAYVRTVIINFRNHLLFKSDQKVIAKFIRGLNDAKNYPKARIGGIKSFPYIERDEHDRMTYAEERDGYWDAYKYDEHGREVERSWGDDDNVSDIIKSHYRENGIVIESDIHGEVTERDSKGNTLYHMDRYGEWWRRSYDDNGKEITYEDSEGNWWDKSSGLETNPFDIEHNHNMEAVDNQDDDDYDEDDW